jgi:hypothetical protein
MGLYVTQAELEFEIERRPGLIPVALDPAHGEALWADLGEYHCYEGFFDQSLRFSAAIRGSALETFTSSLNSLLSPKLPDNCISPTGFIFHAGRCGSTLLTKTLARSRQNLIFSEAPPHNQVWKISSRGCNPDMDLYRHLAVSMGRKRLESYRSHIIKFTSFNIVQYAFVRAAFPGVPALFLFREPGALLNSYYRGAPRWLGKDLGMGMGWSSAEAAVESFFRGALSIHDPGFRCLDYACLSPQSLPAILRYLNVETTDDEFRLMATEFAWDSKSGLVPRPYSPTARGVSPISGPLQMLYDRLTTHAPLLDCRT